MTSTDNVTLEVLSSMSGHTEIFLKDTPEDRAALAEQVEKLIRDGHAVFLMEDGNNSRKIKAYDKNNNEWILVSGRKKQIVRITAKSTQVTAVPRVAGG